MAFWEKSVTLQRVLPPPLDSVSQIDCRVACSPDENQQKVCFVRNIVVSLQCQKETTTFLRHQLIISQTFKKLKIMKQNEKNSQKAQELTLEELEQVNGGYPPYPPIEK
jgi:hypothetical protein